jgi:hypothetical protein
MAIIPRKRKIIMVHLLLLARAEMHGILRGNAARGSIQCSRAIWNFHAKTKQNTSTTVSNTCLSQKDDCLTSTPRRYTISKHKVHKANSPNRHQSNSRRSLERLHRTYPKPTEKTLNSPMRSLTRRAPTSPTKIHIQRP